MAGKPQTLSKGQEEEVIKILRKQIIAGLIIGLALLTGITGISLWGIKIRLENKMENLVAKQFEEPRIQTVVSNVAERKAERLLSEQINPEVERFKKEIASQLSDLRSLVKDTQELKSQSDANAKQIEAFLFSVRKSQLEVDQIKAAVVGIHSNLIKLERGLVEIQYFSYIGRNKFPNPYHKKIMQTLNELLVIAVPDPGERAMFIKELEGYQPKK
jgi:hypothetical protein